MNTESLYQLIEPLLYLADPQKRIFIGYLIASALLAAWVLSRQAQPIKPLIQHCFSKKLWLHPSMLLDLKLIFFNNMLWLLLLAPFFGTQIALALSTKRLLVAGFGAGDMFQISALSISLIYTVVLFIADDFARFFVHYLYHKIPLLWRFHAVHHSATLLTPLTLYRVHFIEMIVNAMRSIFIAGIVGGLFIYLFDGKIAPLQILGISIFSLIFNLAGSNLRHSSIWLGFGKVEKWVMSPAQHQIHHSAEPQHFDKNLGVMIALWDRLFGTWLASENEKVTAYGIGRDVQVKQTLANHLTGL
ncbi:MAG: sterol desaturase family protein [Pseudomonadales bacterium]|nr:sterol desaturase family protein [Pseudomonadales bacterium]